jgi:hypothetical protein
MEKSEQARGIHQLESADTDKLEHGKNPSEQGALTS